MYLQICLNLLKLLHVKSNNHILEVQIMCYQISDPLWETLQVLVQLVREFNKLKNLYFGDHEYRLVCNI